MTFEAYMARCEAVYQQNKYWRWGQTLFNELQFINPKLAEYVRGTPADPFYDNGKCQAFLETVHRYWTAFESVTDERRSNI